MQTASNTNHVEEPFVSPHPIFFGCIITVVYLQSTPSWKKEKNQADVLRIIAHHWTSVNHPSPKESRFNSAVGLGRSLFFFFSKTVPFQLFGMGQVKDNGTETDSFRGTM
jgi:hypothetical protein